MNFLKFNKKKEANNSLSLALDNITPFSKLSILSRFSSSHLTLAFIDCLDTSPPKQFTPKALRYFKHSRLDLFTTPGTLNSIRALAKSQDW